MSTSTPDESAFGEGGASSADADKAAGLGWVVDPAGEATGADGGVENSPDADMLGAFDDPSKVAHDGTGLHH